MNEQLLQTVIRNFINYLPYVMACVFLVGAAFRLAIYYTVKRHDWFAREFEKRVHRYLDNEGIKNQTADPMALKTTDGSFYVLCKKVLERTFYETFAVRDRKSREDIGHVMSMNDRLFLVKQGCAWMVRDILKQLRHLKWSKETPKLNQITRATLNNNPCFNKVFGIFPLGALNDIVSILPGLFIIAGILGTFLGIKGGLVQLGGMNMSDIEGTKTIMDNFLHEIGFAMSSSIVGIAFSLSLHIFNTIFSGDRVYAGLVDRFESAMDLLWYRSDNNVVPENDPKFNENRDPVEALAEEALNLEIVKAKKEMKSRAA